MVTDTFLPLERKHTMWPSDVQVAVTLFSPLALLSNSLRRLVRFSVLRNFVPFWGSSGAFFSENTFCRAW